jgi:hypothetical protein
VREEVEHARDKVSSTPNADLSAAAADVENALQVEAAAARYAVTHPKDEEAQKKLRNAADAVLASLSHLEDVKDEKDKKKKNKAQPGENKLLPILNSIRFDPVVKRLTFNC